LLIWLLALSQATTHVSEIEIERERERKGRKERKRDRERNRAIERRIVLGHSCSRRKREERKPYRQTERISSYFRFS
jgi:hypothetical protein